jgi:hypothetical protein
MDHLTDGGIACLGPSGNIDILWSVEGYSAAFNSEDHIPGKGRRGEGMLRLYWMTL